MIKFELITYREYQIKRRLTESDVLWQTAMLGWEPECVLVGDFTDEQVAEWKTWLDEQEISYVWNRVSKTFVFENESDAIALRLVCMGNSDADS
jgi:hypothetical protein